MTMTTKGGVGETEAKAETVKPWIWSPLRTVTMVTPEAKWRSTSRKSSELMGISSCSRSARGRLFGANGVIQVIQFLLQDLKIVGRRG